MVIWSSLRVDNREIRSILLNAVSEVYNARLKLIAQEGITIGKARSLLNEYDEVCNAVAENIKP